MRIAYVAGTALPSRVASAVNVMSMCRALAAAGHEVTLYARGRQADAAAVFGAFGMAPCFEMVLRAPPHLPLAKNLLYPVLAAREMAARPAPDPSCMRRMRCRCGAPGAWRNPGCSGTAGWR